MFFSSTTVQPSYSVTLLQLLILTIVGGATISEGNFAMKHWFNQIEQIGQTKFQWKFPNIASAYMFSMFFFTYGFDTF